MRACSKCGAYYADDVLAFCLADGTPLSGVDPRSERWNEGSRVIRDQEKALRKRQRNLKWRWIVASALTTLILAMVVANSFTMETTTAATIPPVQLPSGSLSPTPLYNISGQVTEAGNPMPGVKMMLDGAKTTSMKTDVNGNYTFSGLRAGGSYTVTPKGQIKFDPTHLSFENLRRDEPADFKVQAEVYKISGQVTEAGNPMPGVKMMLDGAKTTSMKTDVNGNYTFSGLRAGGSYTVTPKGQMKFDPTHLSFENLRRNEPADFKVQAEVYKISGRVMSLVGPRGGVKILLEGSKLTTMKTDANGNYTFSELRAGGSYTVTPKGQMKFDPPFRSFENLRRDEPADFFESDATPIPPCSETDQVRALKDLKSFEPNWRRKIQGEQAKIIAENVPNNIENAEATLVEIEFQYSFPKPCKTAVVTVTHVWQVHYSSPIAPGKTKSVSRQRLIGCGKLLSAWVCP